MNLFFGNVIWRNNR